MKVHPAAELLPLMSEEELAALTEDIRQHGLLEEIETADGMILDGRNRLKACTAAKVEPRFGEAQMNGSTPTEWVLSKNLHRRHLSTSQRAMVAATAGLNLVPGPGRTSERVADAIGGVSRASVISALRLLREAPDLAAEVKAGTKTVGGAISEFNSREPKRKKLKAKRDDRWWTAAQAAHKQLEAWNDKKLAGLAPREARRRAEMLRRTIELETRLVETLDQYGYETTV